MIKAQVQRITVQIDYIVSQTGEGEDFKDEPLTDGNVRSYVEDEVHAGNFTVSKIETIEIEMRTDEEWAEIHESHDDAHLNPGCPLCVNYLKR